MVTSKVIVLEDVDGCITPNIDAKDRTAHPAMGELVGQLKEIQAAGGLSVISTGRPLHMVKSDPLLQGYPADYAITSAGVEIAKFENGQYVPYHDYETYLLTPPEGKTAFDKNVFDAALKASNTGAIKITDQPAEKVSGHRLGYYVENDPNLPHDEMKAAIIAHVKEVLGDKADFLVIPSHDPHHGKWNVDIMPSKASKLGAAKWLIGHVQKERPLDAAIVWGDSGNDVPAMQPSMYREFGLKPAFIAPANAAPDVKRHLSDMITGEPGVPVHFYANRTTMDHEHGGPGGLVAGLKHVLRDLEILRGNPPVAVEDPSGHAVGKAAGQGR